MYGQDLRSSGMLRSISYVVSCRNFGDCEVRCYIGNGVGSDWFSENVTLANRVTGAWRTREGEGGK